ncbi:MAG: tetratricopeptide repeat protein [Pseudomonadota bacterium]
MDAAAIDPAAADLSPDAAAAWANTVFGFLAHDRQTATYIGATLQAAPDFAMGHAVKGLMLLLLGRSELVAPARSALAEARAARGRAGQPGPERTAMMIEALERYLEGDLKGAAVRIADWLRRAPHDVLALKLDHAIRFVLGDRRGMVAMSQHALPAQDATHPLYGYVLGCHSFSLEENGHYVEAEAHGRAALELAPDDAWGLHAVAHVYDMTARGAAGLRFLETHEAAWAHCNNFGAHVWWHLALFHLDLGAYDRVMELYDGRIRAEYTDDYRDISNGASMLTRLEIEGVDVGDRWEELAALAENRVEPGCVVFADLHYHLALEAAGKRGAADAMLNRLAADAASCDHDMHEVAAVAGLPAARGLTAFRAGCYRDAFDSLRAVRADLQKVGGSHAQRDVFSRVMIEAAIRAGRYDEAEAELAGRTTRRGGEDGFTARRRTAIARARDTLSGVAVA